MNKTLCHRSLPLIVHKHPITRSFKQTGVPSKKIGNWPTLTDRCAVHLWSTWCSINGRWSIPGGFGTPLKSSLGTICLLEPKLYLSPFTSQSRGAMRVVWGSSPPFGGGVELGFGCGTTRKSSTLGTICMLEPKLSHSPFKSQLPHAYCGVGRRGVP